MVASDKRTDQKFVECSPETRGNERVRFVLRVLGEFDNPSSDVIEGTNINSSNAKFYGSSVKTWLASQIPNNGYRVNNE